MVNMGTTRSKSSPYGVLLAPRDGEAVLWVRRSFERARPNQLWQTDLFTYVLKRQNRRIYLVAFMDDHSRFVVSYGLHASQSTALTLEVLRAGIASYGAPEEILTDNGKVFTAVYVTENMVGHKLGEFAPTRVFKGHTAAKTEKGGKK